MELMEYLSFHPDKVGVHDHINVPGAIDRNIEHLLDASRSGPHHKNSVAQKDRLINVVSHKKYRLLAVLPYLGTRGSGTSS